MDTLTSLWLVRWSNPDGFDDFEILEATQAEVETLKERLRRPYFREVSIVMVDEVSTPFAMFNAYLDELEISR